MRSDYIRYTIMVQKWLAETVRSHSLFVEGSLCSKAGKRSTPYHPRRRLPFPLRYLSPPASFSVPISLSKSSSPLSQLFSSISLSILPLFLYTHFLTVTLPFHLFYLLLCSSSFLPFSPLCQIGTKSRQDTSVTCVIILVPFCNSSRMRWKSKQALFAQVFGHCCNTIIFVLEPPRR